MFNQDMQAQSIGMQYTDPQIEDVINRYVSTGTTLELISFVEEELFEYYINNCNYGDPESKEMENA